MSLEICCSKCGSKLNEPGGLAFSPPKKKWNVQKLHLCVKCWKLFIDWMEQAKGGKK